MPGGIPSKTVPTYPLSKRPNRKQTPAMSSYPSITCLGNAAIRPPADLPQSTSEPIFEITGGWIYLVMMFGLVTETIGAGANELSAIFDPSGPGPNIVIGTTDLANIENAPVDTIVVKEADTTGSAWTVTQGHFNAWATAIPYGLFGLPPGTYSINCSGSSTGQMSWHAWWHPLDEGATLAMVDAP